jgi:hypothetical protein
MNLVFFHTDSFHFPRENNIMHRGYWTVSLKDGSFLIVLKCDHASAGKQDVTNAAEKTNKRAIPMPTVRSGKTVHPDTHNSIKHHYGLADTIEPLKTEDILTLLFNDKGDSIFDPDEAL